MSNLDDFDEDDLEILTMEDENGEEKDFIVIDSTEVDGNLFLLIIESDEEDNDESDAFILKQVSSEGDDVVFEEPTDEEFEKVSEIFRNSSDSFEID